jgi:hypothetical protein
MFHPSGPHGPHHGPGPLGPRHHGPTWLFNIEEPMQRSEYFIAVERIVELLDREGAVMLGDVRVAPPEQLHKGVIRFEQHADGRFELKFQAEWYTEPTPSLINSTPISKLEIAPVDQGKREGGEAS